MQIASFLDQRDVTVDVPVGNKREVLLFLVDLLVQNHGEELERDTLLKVLLEREELRSTGIEEGIAFPHCRVPGLDHLVSCFGKCHKGVDFDSFDGKPTYFFFVLLIPEYTQGSHLKALAKLNRLFQDVNFRKHLHKLENANVIFDALIERDKKC